MTALKARRPPEWSAYRSAYGTQRNRRVHIKAPTDARPRSSVKESIAFCGVLATPDWEAVDPERIPRSWSWCPTCLGWAAEYLSQSDRVASLVWEAFQTRAAAAMPTAEALLALNEKQGLAPDGAA